MKLCPRCRGNNSEDANRCVWCGLPLRPETAPPGGRREDDPAEARQTTSESDIPNDPLAGLEGLLPPVPLPPAPEAGYAGTVEPTEKELSDAALFFRIATEPAPLEPPREPPLPPEPPLLSRSMRALFALLVLLAVLTPLVSGGRLDVALRPSTGNRALAQAVEALRAGDRVLVAFDYAPSAAAELAPVRDAVLADLARRSVGLVTLSTRPEGVDLARQSLERLDAAYPGLESGADYALLGYLAGDAAGLRLATADLTAAFGNSDASGLALAEVPLLQNMHSLGDSAALLVFTDDASVARRWVEQVGTRVRVPLLMVTTAAIEPLVIPYAGSGQLTALVSGALGGVPYAAAGQGASLYSADGLLAFWAVLGAAAVWGLLRRPAKNRERRS
jgi:hypothetical protein